MFSGATNLRSFILSLIAALLTVIVFIFDLKSPPEVMSGCLYLVVILYSWILPWRMIEVIIAMLCSILIILKLILTDGSKGVENLNALNSVFSFVVVWISTTLLSLAKSSINQIESAYAQLEEKVEERTHELTAKIQELLVLKRAINEMKDYSIILTDLNAIIVEWNKGAERIHGYKEDEVIGQKVDVLYAQGDLKKNPIQSLLKKSFAHGSVYKEVSQRRKDGRIFWGGVHITPIYNDSGHVSGYFHVTRDLTREKEIQEERARHSKMLETKNKELEQFVYIASHDLQEPMRTFGNVAKMLQEEYAEEKDEDFNRAIGFLQSATKRMQDLISDLLIYSRIGKNKDLEMVDCNEVMELIRSDLESTINKNEVEITQEELPTIMGFPTELRLLFQNMISNAIKFRKKNTPPKIHIGARKIGTNWIFQIEDNGIGIQKKNLDKIFRIFHRLHETAQYEGTGIGLAHCQKIVALHNGEIWVNSIPGKGSTFYFKIPSTLNNQNEEKAKVHTSG